MSVWRSIIKSHCLKIVLLLLCSNEFFLIQKEKMFVPLIWTLLEVRRYSENLQEDCSSNLYYFYLLILKKVLRSVIVLKFRNES